MWQRILFFTMIPCFVSCTLFETQDAAPVVDLQTITPVTHGTHIVQPGESLYAIAWRYGRDYRDLASVNHIAPPYVIYPGQKIKLQKSRHPHLNSTKPKEVTTKASAQKPVTQVTQQSKLVSPEKPLQAPSTEKVTATKNAPPKTTPVVTKPSEKGAEKTHTNPKAEQVVSSSGSKWEWPVKGKILKTFAVHQPGAVNKGIDIAGDLGTPVKAAGAGKVVYRGSGLRGYGQLVIIKHNDTFLSAYAHNSEILVKEGENVKQGQVIAKMGRTDADQVKLHFEIRKNGQPVNPLDFLPGN